MFLSDIVGTLSVTWHEKVDHLGVDLLHQKDEYQNNFEEHTYAQMEEGTALI